MGEPNVVISINDIIAMIGDRRGDLWDGKRRDLLNGTVSIGDVLCRDLDLHPQEDLFLIARLLIRIDDFRYSAAMDRLPYGYIVHSDPDISPIDLLDFRVKILPSLVRIQTTYHVFEAFRRRAGKAGMRSTVRALGAVCVSQDNAPMLFLHFDNEEDAVTAHCML